MRKQDWIFSGVSSIVLIGMIASNYLLLRMIFDMRNTELIVYLAGIALIMLTMTHVNVYAMGEREITQKNWINNHLLFWIMLDMHTLILVARYILPNDRQSGLLPELYYLVHLSLSVPVYFAYKSEFYKKHELILSFGLHLIVYGFLSYTFIQNIIQVLD